MAFYPSGHVCVSESHLNAMRHRKQVLTHGARGIGKLHSHDYADSSGVCTVSLLLYRPDTSYNEQLEVSSTISESKRSY